MYIIFLQFNINFIISNIFPYYIICDLTKQMNQAVKKKLEEVRKYIKESKFREALDQCQVIIMKNNKITFAHIFAGFCYQKLSQDAKAQKAYLQAEQLDPKNIDCTKALYGLYNRKNDIKSTKYLNKLCDFYKKTDKIKYREFFIKLIKIYEQQQQLQMIDKIFMGLIESQKQINSDMVAVAESYFRLSCQNKCFNLKHLASMGIQKKLNVQCKQKLDILLIDIIKYLRTVSKDYGIQPHQFSQTIIYLNQSFPQNGVFLYLLLLDNYAITHPQCAEYIMNEIYSLLTAFYGKTINQYTNTQFIHTEVFVTSMRLAYEYICFFKYFFTINQCFYQYLEIWGKQQEALKKQPLSDQLKDKIRCFILSDALDIALNINNQNSYTRLIFFRGEALKYGGFLQEVIARLAMNVFRDYKQLNQMKNLLKLRIKKDQQNPFLMKYYYDYLIKIGKIFRVFDEQIKILQVLDTIIALDPRDHKYRIQKIWLSFSKYVSQQISITEYCYEELLIQAYYIYNQYKKYINNTQLAILAKKILIIQIHCKKQIDIIQKLKDLIKIDNKNYQIFISLGTVYFCRNQIQQATFYFKEAFNIQKKDYHLNTFLYVCLMLSNQLQQAQNFVEKIYESHSNVYWINYVKSIINMNKRSFEPAQTFLTKALQIFASSRQRDYQVSFQKTHQRSDYSSPYLILQNQYKILQQYLIIPQKIIYLSYPLCSKAFYKQKNPKMELKMLIQMGQILKILGRLGSSLKTLKDAQIFSIKEGLMIINNYQQIQKCDSELALTIVLLQKELATVNYYYKNFKESELHLNRALILIKRILNLIPISKKILTEIYGLFFQISIQRLTTLMKFESYQTANRYIQNFKIINLQIESVLYLKPFYQFQLLKYIHNKSNGQECVDAIFRFLNHFGLQFDKVQTNQFFNKYYSLDDEGKKLVKEAIQDLVVFFYIYKKQTNNNIYKFDKKKILNLIQIFSQSSLLYVMYGILEDNLQMKIGAFLKCIKIDKYTPISIDYLANLYLKQKSFVPASKLFIKSIQNNPFNMKAYYGLIICLFSISLRSLSSKNQEYNQLAKNSLEKVHSFLQYLKSVDPSVQYNLIEFLKIILHKKQYDQFEKKIKIQNGLQAYSQLRRYSKFPKNLMIQELQKDIPLQNIWKEAGNFDLIDKFCNRFVNMQNNRKNMNPIYGHLIKQIQEQTKQYVNSVKLLTASVSMRRLQYLYSKFNLVLLISQKCEYKQNLILKLVNILQELTNIENQLELKYQINEQQKLKQIKINFYLCTLPSSKQIKEKIQLLFKNIQISGFICKNIFQNKGQKQFRKTLTMLIMKYPTDQTLKKILNQLLIVKYQKYIPKLKCDDQKIRFFNQANQKNQNKLQAYHKLCLFYNDAAGWILYIYQSYKIVKNRTKKNLQYWIKILRINKIINNENHNMHQKAVLLFIQIFCKLQILSQNKICISDEVLFKKNKYRKLLDQRLSQIDIYKHPSLQNLQISLKNTQDKVFLALNIYYTIIIKYGINKQIQQILYQIGKHTKSDKQKLYYFVLKFIITIKIQHSSQYQQYQKLIVLQEATKQFPQFLDQNNFSISFIKMNKALIHKRYQQLDNYLGQLSSQKLVHTNDKILACYFDILYCYYLIQQDPQDSNNYDTFKNYLQHTLSISQNNNQFSSFLRYINGIVILKSSQIFNVNRKQFLKQFQISILMNPSSAKIIIQKLIGPTI